MKNKMLITVIIPVYNAVEYLGKCIESVINQSYKELEILLIDDGSDDGSGALCDEYACRDERIRVYHKKNEGLVTARKDGIALARGEAIAFVDSDDWIEPEMYEKMAIVYKKEQVDIVTSGLIYEWESRNRILMDGEKEGVYDHDYIWDNMIPRMAFDSATGRQGITASVSNKLFERKLLKSAIEKVDQSLTLGEDGAVVFRTIALANRIAVMNHAWYHYVQRNNSMIRTYDISAFTQIYKLEQCLKEGAIELGYGNAIDGLKHYVKAFLGDVVETIYGMSLTPISYIFPYELIPKDSRIVLYGAGKVGKSFANCLLQGKYAVLAGWVDKTVSSEFRQIEITQPETIVNFTYDYIVIAIADENIAQDIKDYLLMYCGVDEEKIIWEKYVEVL